MGKRIAFWLAILLFAAGCACCPIGAIGPSPDLTEADLVGTWTSEKGPTITFNADGTFAADHLHGCDEGNSQFDASRPEGGTGTWGLEDPISWYPYQYLELNFASGYSSLRGWQANGDEVIFGLGDPDAYVFCFLTRTD